MRGGFIDLTGKTFGKLTVIRYDKKSKWICICACNLDKEISITGSTLRTGRKVNCGCERRYREYLKIKLPDEYKNKFQTCDSCNENKPVSDFYVSEMRDLNNNLSYKFDKICIICSRKQASDYREENIEEVLKRDRKYKEKNKARLSQEKIRWRLENIERYKAKQVIWRKENKDKVREDNKRRKHKNHIISRAEWKSCKEYFNYCCAYCGIPEEIHKELFREQLHREHVDDKGSVYLDNCVAGCKLCNSSKHTSKLDEWYNPNNPDYTEERYHKIIKWITEDYKLYFEGVRPRRKYKKKK